MAAAAAAAAAAGRRRLDSDETKGGKRARRHCALKSRRTGTPILVASAIGETLRAIFRLGIDAVSFQTRPRGFPTQAVAVAVGILATLVVRFFAVIRVSEEIQALRPVFTAGVAAHGWIHAITKGSNETLWLDDTIILGGHDGNSRQS